jgi:thiol-disulfide isomerase/thioredoxin
VRKKFLSAIIGAGLVLLAPISALAQSCDADAKMANLDFVIKDMNGEDVALSDYAGQVILLDFWATWCAPCRLEIPGFIELLDKYGPQGFIVLGLDVDDPIDAMQSFAAEFEMDYPVLVGADRDDFKDAYGPPVGYPTAFVIGRDGKICHSHTGFAAKETFEQEILGLL